MTTHKSSVCMTMGLCDMAQIKTQTDAAGVAVVTLCNPAKRNAMTLGMWQTLAQTMKALSEDQAVRVVVLRGEGQAAFASGADISEFDQVRSRPEDVAFYDACVEQAETAVGVCTKPVIAAISGACYGGGVGIAASCDLRYVDATARFSVPAGKLGLGYALTDIKRMHRLMGAAAATELLLTARVYDGEAAVNAGMAHACVQDVFAHAMAQAEHVASLAPLTLASIKMALQHLDDMPGAPDVAAVEAAVQACFDSEDYAQGRRAFAQKRAPKFMGR
jgi:enoyl-CoA hydratase/carnithine racemase